MTRAMIRLTPFLGAATLLAACGGNPVEQHSATIAEFCIDCHNDIEQTGNLTLESRDLASLHTDADTWEKVVRKLRGGMMPPADGPQPDREVRVELATWLETELDRTALEDPNPGRNVPFHRLNRSEYRNSVRDLLGVDIDVSELLPADDSSYGFDNIAGVLKVSPTLLERYLTAADEVSRLAVGRPSPFERIDWFRIPDDRSQEHRLPGMPFGTRGGTRIEYTFPVDAVYQIAVDLQRNLNESVPLYAEDQHLEVSVDGERVALFTLPAVPVRPPEEIDRGPDPGISQLKARLVLSREDRAARDRMDEDWNVRVPVSAGEHVVTATFIATTAALDETMRLPFERPFPSGVNIPETRTGAYLRSVEISGPYFGEQATVADAATSNAASTGSAAAASVWTQEPATQSLQSQNPVGDPDAPTGRDHFVTCEPDANAALDETTACAGEILSALTQRAYRRPVTTADVEPLLAFYREGFDDAADGNAFDAGLQLAVKRLLVAPEFLFRVERDPADVAPGEIYPVPDLELASRLSFFLWSSIPDDELIELAAAGELGDDAVLAEQVARMIADPKADAFVENFAGQWLFLRNLEAIVPVQSNFPDFDDTLRQGLRRETEMLFASVLREGGRASDLLTADYTFVNERVAKHYGIEGIKGSHFRRIDLGDMPRRGILGHGSILAVTSYPDRTSPVIRGKWILENLLGTPPPDPPPDVPGLVETDGAGTELTMRERLAQHRADPTCASCHNLMDPLGFAFENYNAIGQWRTLGDAGEPIDASGEMPDGTSFDGVDELRHALLSSDLFVTTMTEKLLTYALGRGVEHYDMPAVRQIVRDAGGADGQLSTYIVGVVNSLPFRMRRAGEPEAVAEL